MAEELDDQFTKDRGADMTNTNSFLINSNFSISSAPGSRFECDLLGKYHFERGEWKQAIEFFDRAIQASPDDAHAHRNKGNAHLALGQRTEALDSFRRALAIDPTSARLDAAQVLLALGQFREGWPLYESRRDLPTQKPRQTFAPELRTLADLSQRRVLVFADQGFGDILQFGRYVPLLAAISASVWWELPQPLISLVKASVDVNIFPWDEPQPQHDFQVLVSSLAGLFDTTVETIPPPLSLRASSERLTRWRRSLGTHGWRVAVAWQGNPKHGNDRNRSFPLAALASIAAVPGIRLISVQKQHGFDQLQRLPPGMTVETPGDLVDFEDTAAVMSLCDLVISCDSAPAHLAGALGRPVWIPLPHVADWRWMTDREDSPWYPTARLFRQPTPGDWASVFARMADELRRLTRPPGGGTS